MPIDHIKRSVNHNFVPSRRASLIRRYFRIQPDCRTPARAGATLVVVLGAEAAGALCQGVFWNEFDRPIVGHDSPLVGNGPPLADHGSLVVALAMAGDCSTAAGVCIMRTGPDSVSVIGDGAVGLF